MIEGQTHKIFTSDPLHLSSYLNEYVELLTKYSTSISGFVTAIDPVTESVVLAERSGSEIITRVVMGHAIDKIDKKHPPCQVLSPMDQAPEETGDLSVETRKMLVIKWLKSNMLPVEESNGILQIHQEQLCILPPYTPEDCVSSNAVILQRIHKLLANIPSDLK